MTLSLGLGPLVAGTVASGFLAGGSVIRSLVEPTARRRIGLEAMAAYHRATDLGPGLVVYPPLGLGAPALTLAAALAIYLGRDVPATVTFWAYLAAALSVAHIFTTMRAALNLLRLRDGPTEEQALREVYERFTKWQGAGAIVQVFAFIAVVLSLASKA